MTHDELCKLALETAEKSFCKKRKVGAVIVNDKLDVLATGYNYLPIGTILDVFATGYNQLSAGVNHSNCEDSEGNTLPDVVHAEIAAIQNWLNSEEQKLGHPFKIYVTHQPCKNCQAEIDKVGLEVVLVEKFMKFDAGKLRYGLIPPEATEGLARVLTYGAKKYKPNNWQQCEDTDRYVDALYRHLEAWRKGEKRDQESGLLHLEHALTNISFLLWFERREDDNNDKNI